MFLKSTMPRTVKNNFPLCYSQTATSTETQPTMWTDISSLLQPDPEVIIDMTFGSGGHCKQLLKTFPSSKIFALDRDPVAYEECRKLAEKNFGRVFPLLGKFSDLPELLERYEIGAKSVDLFLFEFGPSQMQLENESRGFSPLASGALDMRMNGSGDSTDLTAADILEAIDELDLTRILRIYGNEKKARQISRAIIESRSSLRINTTDDLVQLLESIVGSFSVDQKTVHYHSAYKTFQALRMFVNNELNEINHAILLAQIYLKERGQLVTISQNRLEDMIVKQHLTGRINDNPDNKLHLKYSNCAKTYPDTLLQKIVTPKWKMTHKHVIMPEKTVEINAPSLRLRVLDKCEETETN